MKIFGVGALLFFLSLVALPPVTASGDEYAGQITVRQIAKTTVTANGQPIEYLRTDKPEVTAVIVEIPPGGETGWHLHPVPLYGYVVSGTLEMRTENGDVHTYHAGDAIIEMVDTPHNGENRGTTPVKLLGFYTGGFGIPNTVEVQGK